MTRRQALLLASGALAAQPPADLANTLEMEAAAQSKLSPALFREIAGSDRAAFDRITFRPRLMVNALDIDLSIDLFGQRLFAPILVGPTALHGRFHPDAENATLAGAAAAKTTVILAAETSVPVSPDVPHWRQRTLTGAPGGKPTAMVLTLTGQPFDWKLPKSPGTPLLVKGIMSPREAKLAIDNGAAGIIVSNYRQPTISGLASPIDVLPAIAAEVNGRVPILIDGSFRRGSDILKALALGARAVLIGRPVLWGLAAYGAKGVQQILEELQTELARDMVMCGITRCAAATPRHVKIHRR